LRPSSPDHPRIGGPFTGVQIYPDRVVINLLSLKRLICAAFNIELWQIQGGEGWTENDLFDIEAKPQQTSESNPYSLNHSNVTIGDPRLRQMMQALLTERFQLRCTATQRLALFPSWKRAASQYC